MDKITGLIRTAIATIGGFLIAVGWFDADTVGVFVSNIETIIGAVLAIAAAGGSIYAKIKQLRSKEKTAVVSAANRSPTLVD